MRITVADISLTRSDTVTLNHTSNRYVKQIQARQRVQRLNQTSREISPRPVNSLHHGLATAKTRVLAHQTEGANNIAHAAFERPEGATRLATHDIGIRQKRAKVVAHVAVDHRDALQPIRALPAEIAGVADMVLITTVSTRFGW